jgi:two-component system, sensor histidine kinase and response regulator
MEAMGGTIEIDSELDNGSTFSCTLNLEVVQNGFTVEEPLRENIYFKNCNVLLVEDNEDSQEVARELLQKAGAEVDVAFNGKIALQMIQDKAYDLVLMDIQMQIMGGFSSTHKFRKNGFTDLPIIALSASESNLQRKRSIKAGMNDYISKPITYKKLQNILNTWCEDKKTCLPSTLKRDSICWANQIKHMPGLVLDNELCEYWLNKESFLHNLNLFISKLPLEVQSLHKLLNEGKVNDALQLIHRLKGSVKLYKALRLFESLKACERQLQKVGTADSSLLSELDAAVKQILE